MHDSNIIRSKSKLKLSNSRNINRMGNEQGTSEVTIEQLSGDGRLESQR